MIEENILEKKLHGTPKQKTAKIYKSKESYSSSKSSSKSSKKVSISSIHFKKVNPHSFKHNAREEEKKADTIFSEFSKDNEFDVGAKEALEKFNKLYKDSKENRLKRGLNKTADKKNTLWEAIVNLKTEHTLKDVQALAKKIEKETGFISLQVAIHKDEGQEKDGKLIRKNHHAHLSFFTLSKDEGKQMYRREHMNRTKLQKLQDITAEHLGMQRGTKGSKAKRLDHKTYKAIAKEREAYEEKESYLKQAIKQAREELQKQNASRPDYAKLEQVNKDLKLDVKNKDLTLEELNETLSEKLKTLEVLNKMVDRKEKVIKEFKDNESERTLYKDGGITRNRVKVKEGLFSSKEVYIYNNNSVEHFMEQSNKKETKLKNEVRTLEKDKEQLKEKNSNLEKKVLELKELFKSQNIEKVKKVVKESLFKNEGIER